MFVPGRVAITLIAILVAVILYWVTKILSVTTMSLVQVNFTSWPTWGQLTFQAFPVLVLIMLLVWAFRQLNPERKLGEIQDISLKRPVHSILTPTAPIGQIDMGKSKKKKSKQKGAFDL